MEIKQMLSIITNCPVCDSNLIRVKDQLFCRSNNCSAQSSKAILHFAKTMKIMGLGEKTLEKLNLESICDLYELTNDKLIQLLGEKIGTKLFNQITNSKVTTLATYITSFGIPLIGDTASSKLSKVANSLWDINSVICEQAGLGEKATDNLLQWISKYKDIYYNLPIIINNISEELITRNILCNVVITGKLNDFSSREKAKQHLESKGIKVLSSLSSNANYLICDQEDSSSSSYKKAKQLNIPVITMKELLNII